MNKLCTCTASMVACILLALLIDRFSLSRSLFITGYGIHISIWVVYVLPVLAGYIAVSTILSLKKKVAFGFTVIGYLLGIAVIAMTALCIDLSGRMPIGSSVVWSEYVGVSTMAVCYLLMNMVLVFVSAGLSNICRHIILKHRQGKK